MTWPSLDVKSKRRLHNHRFKAKRKNVCTQHCKDTSDKTIQPTRITHKRLTNKSGFCFNGAVQTSSVFRNSRKAGHGVEKPKKGSTEFDLLCLLKAAKNKEVSDEISSASVGVSSEVDYPSNSVQPYSDENNVHTKHKRKAYPESKKAYEFNSRSSSENNLAIFGNENNDSEDIKEIFKSLSHKRNDNMYQGSHESVSIKEVHCIDPNISSDNNNALQPKCRSSLSTYQKFAEGTVEALVLEKKKQFGSLSCLRDIELDLNDIFIKTHNKLKDVPHLGTREIEQTHKNGSPFAEAYKLGIIKNKTKPEDQFVVQIESETKPAGQNCDHTKDDVLFKEKCVAAWVKAIPGNIPTENNEEFGNNRKLKPKFKEAHMQTEREFLKNIKKDATTFKSRHLNPLKLMDNSSIRNVDHFKCIVSPHMPPHKALGPVKLMKEKKDNLENGANKFGYSSFPWQENQLAESNREKFHPEAVSAISPLRKKQLTYYMQRPQQWWKSWCKDSDEHFQPGGKFLLESPSCPSPSCSFDPPAVKRPLTTPLVTAKSRIGSYEDSPLMWSQFPKLQKRDQKEKFPCGPVVFNSKKDTALKTLPYIKFSPRKMF